jgi:general secretion pathway protein L
MNTIEKLQYDLGQWYETSSIGQFLRWWTTQLKSFVPEKYQALLFPKPTKVLLVQNGKGVKVWLYENDEVLKQDAKDSEEEWWHQLQHIINQADGKKVIVHYLIPNDTALVRKIGLPQGAKENLDEVISFELDKYVPFNANQVQLAYKIDKENSNDEKLLLDLAVLPKQDMQEILKLCDEKSVTLDAIDVNRSEEEEVPSGIGVNLLPQDKRKAFDYFNLKLNIGLVLLLTALIYFVMYTSISNKEDKIERLSEINAELQKQARTAKLLRKELKSVIVSSKFLKNKKDSLPSMGILIADLTTRLPDGTYITRLKVNTERLEITGQSDNANSLVPELNKSENWYAPQIVGGVVPDPRTQKEKFTIKADLQEPQAEGEDVNNS